MANSEKHMENVKIKPIYCELSANDLEPTISEIDSLCMECGKTVSSHGLQLNLFNRKYILQY